MDLSDRILDDPAAVSFPAILLSAQYHAAERICRQFDGERALMRAVLTDAINCYLRNAGCRDDEQRALFREAREWIEASDGTGPFAFENLCESLGFQPDALRAALRFSPVSVGPSRRYIRLPVMGSKKRIRPHARSRGRRGGRPSCARRVGSSTKTLSWH